MNFYAVFAILFKKKIVAINKMELSEKIYPNLPEARNIPNAPPLETTLSSNDNGQSFRFQKISEIQTFLENEVKVREQLSKQYLKISKAVDNVEAGLTVVCITAGAGGITLPSTIVAIPVTIALEGCALAFGVSALVSKFMVRKIRTKSEKKKSTDQDVGGFKAKHNTNTYI